MIETNRMATAFMMGVAWSMGRKWAKEQGMALDAKRDLRDVRWVTINGTHVPISKKTGEIVGHLKNKIEASKSAMVPYRQAKVTRERAHDAYSSALKKLKLAKAKADKEALVQEMAEALIGFVERSFNGYGYRKVIIDKRFAKHCKKFFYDKRNKPHDSADLLLYALSKLPDVIANGETAGDWHPDKDPNHHKDEEFLNVYKQFKRNGKNITVIFDLSRKKQDKNSKHRSHNVNVTGIASYETKRQALGLAKDSLDVIEVVGVRIR